MYVILLLCYINLIFIFFFKQKTAYEMRISDWSSDVCSSDLNHLDRQPFGQMPFLDDDDVRIFESGACLLHLARKSEVLMPRDVPAAAETLQWGGAAPNASARVAVHWGFLRVRESVRWGKSV